MAQKSQRRTIRQASAGVLAAALLAACGGGEILAILQIVTPLAGDWRLADTGGRLEISSAENGAGTFLSTLPVEVTLPPPFPPACGADSRLKGTLDNGKLTLFPAVPASTTACINGRFTDLRRLELTISGAGVPTQQVYLNDRVFVSLQEGLWVSENGQLTLKFKGPGFLLNDNGANKEPLIGCDVSTATPTTFNGTMTGFNTTTLARPKIDDLRSATGNTLLFSNVEFVDGATMTLRSASGQNVTLKRKPDPVGTGTLCP